MLIHSVQVQNLFAAQIAPFQFNVGMRGMLMISLCLFDQIKRPLKHKQPATQFFFSVRHKEQKTSKHVDFSSNFLKRNKKGDDAIASKKGRALLLRDGGMCFLATGWGDSGESET